MGQSPGVYKHRASSCPFSIESRQNYALSIDMWQSALSTVNQWSSLILGAPSCKHDWLSTWLISVSSISKHQLITHDPKPTLYIYYYCIMWPAPIPSHIIRLFSVAQDPRQTNTLISGMTFQDLRDSLWAAKGKGQVSLWTRLNSLL